MIHVTQLIDDWVDMFGRAYPLQREAMLSSFAGANRNVHGNQELWEAIVAAVEEDEADWFGMCDDLDHVAAMRAALDRMPLADWRTFNDVLFILARGNVFDEKFEAVEGGGIEYEFSARYVDFLGLVEEEARHLQIGEPSLLDVGCWQGTLMLELAQRGYRTFGVDSAEALEEVIGERVGMLTAEDRDRVLGFRSGWAHQVLWELPHFDIVTCQETLEHVPTAVLGRTCDAILEAARHSVLVTVPGWDDKWPGHLRVFSEEQLVTLFRPDKNDVEVVRPAGGMCYTTVRVRKR